MGFFHSISKIVSKASGIGDPVSKALRKQGGTLGAVGGFINPGAAAADKFAGGAPINARNMLDPGNFVYPGAAPPSAAGGMTPPQAANPWQAPTMTREQMVAQAIAAHAGQARPTAAVTPPVPAGTMPPQPPPMSGVPAPSGQPMMGIAPPNRMQALASVLRRPM